MSGDSAYLVRFEPPNTTELRVFGDDLSGGMYTERIQVEEKALEIEMQYEHRRLGRGKTLHARFTSPLAREGESGDGDRPAARASAPLDDPQSA